MRIATIFASRSLQQSHGGANIGYINTDLDLISNSDARELVGALEAHGLFVLHLSHREDARWHASLETDVQYSAPEPNIANFLTAIESLPEMQREQWLACSQREFNIGYEIGPSTEPQRLILSRELLARVASVQVSLALTVYPSREEA